MNPKYTYTIIPGGVSITGCEMSDKRIAIPSEIDGFSVIEIGAHAFKNYKSICHVILPESILTIGDGAFDGCEGLVEIKMSFYVRLMGSRVFCGCHNLATVNLPLKVTKIGNALAGCTGLKSLVIPNGVTHIGGGAFDGCTTLEYINIPDSVVAIESDAFNNYAKITTAVVPDHLFNKTISDLLATMRIHWIEIIFKDSKNISFNGTLSPNKSHYRRDFGFSGTRTGEGWF